MQPCGSIRQATFGRGRSPVAVRSIVHAIITTLALLLAPARASALIEPFTPAYLISDEEFSAAGAMSCGEIQGFLNERTGVLKTHIDANRYASQIVCDAAIAHGVNPRILLTMAQKEMGVLTDPAPDEKQLTWAMGCGPGWQSTRGFAAQADCAARTLRKRFDQAQTQLGAVVDGVTPVNRATLALYRYTTHVSGNRVFYQIWTRYWPNSVAPANIAVPAAASDAAAAAVTIDLAAVETTPPLKPDSTCRSGWARGAAYLVTPNAAGLADSTNAAVWRPNLPRSGQYRVAAFIPKRPPVAWACGTVSANADTRNARYEFTYAGGARFDILLNQAPLDDVWAELGVFQFDAGNSGYVRLSDITGETANSRWVSIGAMRFEWVAP
jgi:hypothetical protein